jgi:hypothetical protein
LYAATHFGPEKEYILLQTSHIGIALDDISQCGPLELPQIPAGKEALVPESISIAQALELVDENRACQFSDGGTAHMVFR